MPETSRFLGIIIRMFFAGKEHNPPHFHAHYGDYSAVFSIDKLEMIRGSLPPRVKGLVIEWADLHKSELQKNWELVVLRLENGYEEMVF